MAELTSPESLNSGTNAGYASALVATAANSVLAGTVLDNLTYTTFLADLALTSPAGGGTRSSPL